MPESRSANSNDRLRRLGRLALKELREILRDRRTIVTLVLMPLLMYPLMSIAFNQFFVSQLGTVRTPRYTIGFQDVPEAAYFKHVLMMGGLDLASFDDEKAARTDGTEREICLGGILPELDEGLRENSIDVGLRIAEKSRGDVHADPHRDLAVDIELHFVPQSTNSRNAAAFIEKYLAAANAKFLERRLRGLGVTQRAVPLRTVRKPIDDSGGAAASVSGTMSITAVVPFILILMTVTGAVYPAIDLTAGERERGTLEVLIAAPIPRIGVLLAKYFTVLSVALLTAAANLLTMTVTIMVSGLGKQLFGESGITPGVIAAVFGLLLLFAAFFSAVLLVITSTARSFKEAQAYLIPLMLVSLAPGMLSLMPEVELSGLLLVTPLANIVLLGRDLFALKATASATTVVVASTLLYAAAAIGLAARIFGAESVLYSTHSGWSDLLRRPREPQRAPTITAAFVCLAGMFPTYFFLINLLGRAGDSIVAQQVTGAVMTAVVFGGFPLAACHFQRVPIAPAFRLPHSPFSVFFAVVVLGFSLWTLSHETVVLLHNWREVELTPKLVEALQHYADKLRTLPVPLVVLSMAVTPAVFEEIFFRGFLFAALRTRTSAAATILSTALVFGLFHLITPNPLAGERFVSSTFVGLVLGWVRWRTGSLLPGILLHTLHNGFLILVAIYEPQLMALGIGISQEKHLSYVWLAGGAIAVCVGLTVVYAATRRIASDTTRPATEPGA